MEWYENNVALLSIEDQVEVGMLEKYMYEIDAFLQRNTYGMIDTVSTEKLSSMYEAVDKYSDFGMLEPNVVSWVKAELGFITKQNQSSVEQNLETTITI